MSRIHPLVPVQESALADLDSGARTTARLDAVWAHRPEANEAKREFGRILAQTGTLSSRLVELVRLRIAFHNQCRSCMANRYEPDIVDQGLVCSLERPAEAPDLTDAERSALRFADLFATDHLSIDDDVLDDLRRYFDEGQIVELGLQCARCVGFGRLNAIAGVYEDLPEQYREDTPVATPW
jgi:alkylhydroperoxidase family enzyme